MVSSITQTGLDRIARVTLKPPPNTIVKNGQDKIAIGILILGLIVLVKRNLNKKRH